jgi:hypothetical protein
MEGLYDIKLKDKPFSITKTYTMSLHEKSNLRKDLISWRGKPFTQDEITVFEPKKLLGVCAQLNLIESGEYINIASISPVAKDYKAPAPVNPPVYFSLVPEEFDQSVFDSFSDYLKAKISASPEYKLVKGEPLPDDGGDPELDRPW